MAKITNIGLCRIPLFGGDWNRFIIAAPRPASMDEADIEETFEAAGVEMGRDFGAPYALDVDIGRISDTPIEFVHAAPLACGMVLSEQRLPRDPIFVEVSIYLPFALPTPDDIPWAQLPIVGAVIYSISEVDEDQDGEVRSVALSPGLPTPELPPSVPAKLPLPAPEKRAGWFWPTVGTVGLAWWFFRGKKYG